MDITRTVNEALDVVDLEQKKDILRELKDQNRKIKRRDNAYVL
jgi:predicted Zn-ribbon and HTH transcriptional regulator